MEARGSLCHQLEGAFIREQHQRCVVIHRLKASSCSHRASVPSLNARYMYQDTLGSYVRAIPNYTSDSTRYQVSLGLQPVLSVLQGTRPRPCYISAKTAISSYTVHSTRYQVHNI